MPCRRLVRVFLLGSLALPLSALCGAAQEPAAPPEILPAPAVVAGPNAITIDELSALAESSSPAMREAQAAVATARGEAVQAGLYPNPVVQGGTNQIGGKASQYVVTVDQEIVTGGKLRLSRAAALQGVRKAEQEFVRTRFGVLTEVRKQYATLLAAQRRVEVLREQFEILKNAREAAIRLEKAGEGTRLDSLLLGIDTDQVDLTLRGELARLEGERGRLAAFLSQPGLAIPTVAGDIAQPLPDYAGDLVARGLIQENAAVQAANLEIARSQALLARARVEPIPNVTIQGGYQRALDPTNNQAIIQFSLPIPIWNRNQGNIRAAEANVARSMESANLTVNTLSSRLAQLVGEYQAAVREVDVYRKEVLPKLEQSLKILQEAFKKGQVDLLRVLQFQRSLVTTQLGLVDAEQKRWTAAAEISGLLQSEKFP